MHNKVFCIIVLYNAMRWIEKCLSSLKASSVPVSVVCVDNCSTDGSVEFITNAFPEVSLICNKENKGFGQANNQGIEYAYKQGAEHFFLLNQDAWVYPETVKILVETQLRYNLGLVSPIHLNGSGQLLDHNFFESLIVRPKYNQFFHDALIGKTRDYYIPEFTVCAAAWMLSKRCIDTVGGFDPLFFHYGEDDNYFQRVLYHHQGVGVVPSSFIHHDREYHGNIGVYNKRRTATKLLALYSNINDNKKFSIKKLKLHVLFIKAILRLFFTFKFISAFQIVNGYVEWMKKIPQIKKSRKMNVIPQPNWLYLERN